MRSMVRIGFMGAGIAVFWAAAGTLADAREDPMARHGCHRHHFHHHKHAGYHCDTGPLAGQDFDSKADLVKALKAQGIDPSATSKSKKPAAASQ